MKHILILITLLTLGPITLFAQETIDTKIQKARKDFFEEELQLSASESKNFWPIYNQMKEDQRTLKNEYEVDRKIELMSDQEVEAHLLKTFELEEKQIALKRQYFTTFQKAIPIRKIALLRKTEQKFKRSLLKRMRNRRQGKQGNRRNGNGQKGNF